MTSLGTLELQLTADPTSLYSQLNNVRTHATQVARDIENQINQAFSPRQAPAQTGSAGTAAGKSFAAKFRDSIGVIRNELNSLFSGQSTSAAGGAGTAAGQSFTNGVKDAVSPIKGILDNVFVGAGIGAGVGVFNSITGAINGSINSLQRFAGDVFNVVKDFQGFESSLKTFMQGNEEGMNKFVAQLEKFAATTPYELKDLQQAAIGNLAGGAKPDQIIKDLKTIGEAASGANTDLNGLMNVYSKTRITGRVYQGELGEFQGRGVPVVKSIGKMLGGASDKEVMALASEGKIKFEVLEKALQTMTEKGGIYFGAMANKSKTLAGGISNISDALYTFQKGVGQAFEPIMNYGVRAVTELIKGFSSANGALAEARKESEKLVSYLQANPQLIDALSKAVQELVSGGVKMLVQAIKYFAEYLEKNPDIIKNIADAFNSLWSQTKDIFGGVLEIFKGITFVIHGWQLLCETINGLWNDNKDTLNDIWETTKIIASLIWGGMVGAWNAVAGVIETIVKAVQSLIDRNIRQAQEEVKRLSEIFKPLSPLVNSIGKSIGDWSSGLGSAIQKAAEFAGNSMPGIGSAFQKATAKAQEFWKWATGDQGQVTTPQATNPAPAINFDKSLQIIKSLPQFQQGLNVLTNPDKEHHDGNAYYQKNGQRFRNDGGYERLAKDLVLATKNGKQLNAPVSSAVAGTVNFRTTGQSGGYGNLAEVTDNQGRVIGRYAHLNKFNSDLKPGDKVAPGQVLGYQGSTGHSTGTHLHIEIPKELWAEYIKALKTGDFSVLQKMQGVSSSIFSQTVAQMVRPVQQGLRPPTAPGGILWGKAANYAPSDLSGLTSQGKKAVAALTNPRVRAFLDAVAIAENGDIANTTGGYGVLVGSENKDTFDPNKLNSHPRRRVQTKYGKSSATGRYQTMDFVWDDDSGYGSKGLGLKDFKPQSQEVLAVGRLMYRGVLEDVMKGNIAGVFKRSGNRDASSEWASLQGNPYGQGTGGGNQKTFIANYNRFLQQPQQATPQQSATTETPNQGQESSALAQLKRNLELERIKLGQAKWAEIKDEYTKTHEAEVAREKQTRTQEAQSRKSNFELSQLQLNNKINRAEDPEAKGLLERKSRENEITQKQNEERIKNQNEVKDLNRALEAKKYVLEQTQIRIKEIEDSEKDPERRAFKIQEQRSRAGGEDLKDYTEAIASLQTIAGIQEQINKLELDNFRLTNSSGDNWKERSKARERELDSLNRSHEKYIDELKLQSSGVTDDRVKQSIQALIEKTNLQHQAKVELIGIENAINDAQDRKVTLLGKDGLKSDSIEINRLGKEIDNLVAKYNATADKAGIDLKVFDIERKRALLQGQRGRDAEDYENTYSSQSTDLRSQSSLARTQQLKAELQFQSEKLNLAHEVRTQLEPLKNQYDDLVKTREQLISNGASATSEPIQILDEQITRLNQKIKLVGENSKVSFDILTKESLKTIEQGRIADLESALSKESGFTNAQNSILSGQAKYIQGRGGDQYKAAAIEGDVSKSQEQIRYKQELLQIEQQIAAARATANEYSETEIATMRTNADMLHQINLENISLQVRTLGKDLADVGKNALGSFFGDIISGSKSAVFAFKDLVGNIAQQLTQLAVKMAISGLFGGGSAGKKGMGGGLFGSAAGSFGDVLGGGGGGLFSSLLGGGADIFGGGGGGSFVSSLLGFNQGGIVPNFANGGSVQAVADAMHRERVASGKQPVLAALTPGEMVLTINQAKKFQELRLDKVLNFANGGIVSGQNLGSEIGGKTTTVNVPVTVQGGGDSSIDVPKLQNSLRSVVVAEIQKQQRSGGALNR